MEIAHPTTNGADECNVLQLVNEHLPNGRSINSQPSGSIDLCNSHDDSPRRRRSYSLWSDGVEYDETTGIPKERIYMELTSTQAVDYGLYEDSHEYPSTAYYGDKIYVPILRGCPPCSIVPTIYVVDDGQQKRLSWAGDTRLTDEQRLRAEHLAMTMKRRGVQATALICAEESEPDPSILLHYPGKRRRRREPRQIRYSYRRPIHPTVDEDERLESSLVDLAETDRRQRRPTHSGHRRCSIPFLRYSELYDTQPVAMVHAGNPPAPVVVLEEQKKPKRLVFPMLLGRRHLPRVVAIPTYHHTEDEWAKGLKPLPDLAKKIENDDEKYFCFERSHSRDASSRYYSSDGKTQYERQREASLLQRVGRGIQKALCCTSEAAEA